MEKNNNEYIKHFSGFSNIISNKNENIKDLFIAALLACF
jgi:hypothetical protein